MDTAYSIIKYPNHHVPEEVASTLVKYRDQEIKEQTRQENLAKLSRPTKEERKAMAEIYASGGLAGKHDNKQMKALHDIQKRRFDRIQEAIKKYLEKNREEKYPVLPPLDWDFRNPISNDFWWAETEWFVSGGFTAEFRSDGLHFFGTANESEGDLLILSFGAKALFEIQAERIPPSPSGRWLSNPHVELFGGLHGGTGGGAFVGDTWSKCWMHRKQQLFQYTFGPAGPVPLERGMAEENQTLIFEEEESRNVRVAMPGFRYMPPVIFGNINTANSLWALLEIRFDIQLEEGYLWMDPEILLRTFQWRLVPV